MIRPRSVGAVLCAASIGLAAGATAPAPASAFTPEQAKAPMTVTIVRSDDRVCGSDCPEWLAMTGRIDVGTVGRLQAALAKLGSRRVPVLVDSPGGESKAGLALGQMIRAKRLDVVVAGTTLSDCAPTDRLCLDRLKAGVHPGSPVNGVSICASACVFLLAGGVERIVPPGSFVGVHQAKQVQTFHPVINTFRVLKRMVGGRPVEISRTLVATRALPSRTVVTAAPEALYSAFDRFLIRMGIDGSIMPLIRATPPSGIHWMTADELASTRVATRATFAAVVLAREAAPAKLADPPPAAPVAAALTLDDGRRWLGSATWRLDLSAAKAPKLTVDVTIPEKRLTATMSFVKSTTSGDAAYSGAIRFDEGSDSGPSVAEMRPPQFCFVDTCAMPMTPSPGFDGSRFGSYAFDTPFRWGDDLLSGLRDRFWLDLPVRTAEGWGKVAISLAGAGSVPIATWEQLCCAIAIPSGLPRPAPDPALPIPPKPGPPRPAQPVAAPPPSVADPAPAPRPAARTVDTRANFDFQMPDLGHSADGTAPFSWVFLAPDRAGAAGMPVLLATTHVGVPRLSMSLEVAPAAPTTGSRLLFTLHPVVQDPLLFGPITTFSASTELGATGDPLLLPVKSSRSPNGSGFWLAADVPLTGEMPKRIEIEFDDARKRRVTLVVPVDDSVAAVLQAAARESAAGGW